VLHLVREIAARCLARERLSILMIEGNGILHDLTELLKHGFLVGTMAAAIDQPRGASDKALIFLGSLDDLGVPCAFLHDCDSSIASFTARI